ncbi:hypothetical protein DFH06DRAFT_329136 [Mycena polygramma]|nr:hypothetical protein DFH06DRAFT_329136 [Mycena polygramma]
MSTRGACGVCPANYCFSYESDGTTQLCFCGHPATTHPFLPSLPPRGPCPLCRCPGFQYTTVEAARPGSTLCIRTTCEHAYITHARLPEAAATAAEAPLSSAPPARAAVTPTSSLASVTSVPPPMVPARATPGNIWSIAGSQAAGTADGRRRQQAALHGRAWGPGSGSQYPRGTHRAFPSSTQQGKQRETAGPTVLKFAFYPFSLTWPGNEDISEEDADLFPAREFRIVGNGEELFKKFAIYNLLFTFTVPADRETSNSPRSFYQELDDCIQAWAKDACIQFYPHTPAPSPTHHAVQSDSWNMHKFSQVEWQLLSVGNKERALGSGRRITASLITWTQFTLAQFSKVAKPVVSPIDGDECYVLVPKHGPLRGILPNDPTNHIHVCLPFHVLATVPGTPFHDVAHVVCHPRCHPSPLVDRQASRARPVAHLTRQATSSTHQTASSTPLFIADDDDQPEVRSLTEEEQETRDMEQAIRQSLETAPPPPNNQGTSNAIAGPSTLFQPSVRAHPILSWDPLNLATDPSRHPTGAISVRGGY